jgi:N utilization substance protein B
MRQRTKARKDALEILFQREITGQSLSEVLKVREEARGEGVSEFCLRIIQGVEKYKSKIDQLIREYTDNWALERMPIVDRNIIRMGLYEILYEPDIPVSVSINESVELAKVFGSQDSGKFVNGILGRIAQELKTSLRNEE